MNPTTILKLTALVEQLVNEEDVWAWLLSLRAGNPTIPEPLPDPEPEPENKYPGYKVMTRKYTKDIMVGGVRQAAYIFPLKGKDLQAVIIEFSDGQPGWKVRNPSHWDIPFSGKWVKYQPKASDSKTGNIEVYAERGTKPSSVTIYYK